MYLCNFSTSIGIVDNKEAAKLLRYNTTRGLFSILHALKGIEYGSNKTRIRITADFPKIGKNKIRGTSNHKKKVAKVCYNAQLPD